MKILAILVVTLIAAQGLLMLVAPRRFAAIELWKYRLVGAQPAKPGQGAFLFYRIFGVALCAFAAFLTIQFVPE